MSAALSPYRPCTKQAEQGAAQEYPRPSKQLKDPDLRFFGASSRSWEASDPCGSSRSSLRSDRVITGYIGLLTNTQERRININVNINANIPAIAGESHAGDRGAVIYEAFIRWFMVVTPSLLWLCCWRARAVG